MNNSSRKILDLTDEERPRSNVVSPTAPTIPSGPKDFRRRPFAEVFPELAESIRRSRGRPAVESPKRRISLRLDPDVIDAFKATGKGWQGRINDALRKTPSSISATRRLGIGGALAYVCRCACCLSRR